MDAISNIGLITVFLLVLISAFLLTNRSKQKSANTLFACFLLVTSFDISALFLGLFFAENEFFNQLRVASVFLQMPFFYLYVRKTCFSDFTINSKLLLHGIPFLIFISLFIFVGINREIDILYAISSQIQYYVYITAIFITLFKYKQIHLEQHSLRNETYRWLITTTILFLIGNSFVVFRGLFEALNEFDRFPFLNIIISLFGLFVVSWFVLKTMRNPELFTQVEEQYEQQKKAQYAEHDGYQEQLNELQGFMQEHKPYLEEALTLQQLSEQTNIPSKQLSFIINQVIGKHYFDFINFYRIEEAQRLLKESDLTIQQIMYEVGFNSKSSFNTAFKKNTSLTPSQYRENPV